jgi:uncharacterized protein (UPF0332 family)
VGIAQDLLSQASHIATYEGENPSQASLRRAVSTAYYALFHLLTEEAALLWRGSPEAGTGVTRAFQHGSMKSTSLKFRGPVWHDWRGNGQPVPEELRRVAAAFADLQEERHTADYDNHEQWSLSEVQALLRIAADAFVDWESIRTHPMAGNYLLAMLLPKQRS